MLLYCLTDFNLWNRIERPRQIFQSVGVNYLFSAEQLCLFWTVEDAGPYKERLNFLMRSSLYRRRLFYILFYGLFLFAFDFRHHFNANLMSAALEFVFKEYIDYVLSKARADNARAHAKHVCVVMSASHFCRECV